MKRRVLVTGARGFIGSHLCARLEASGCGVVRVARGEEPGSYVVPAEISDAFAIVHLAFPTDHGDRAVRPLAALAEVARGTAAIVELAARLGAQKLILASSGKVYGRPTSLPTSETHAVAPTNELGRLKALAEQIATLGALHAGLGVTCVRLFNVYGEGQAASFVVPKLVRAAVSGEEITLGEIDHRRDFVHVADAVRAFEHALGRPPEPGESHALNVGTGRAATVRELIAILEAHVGAPMRSRTEERLLRPDEPPEERADASALRRSGWSPSVSLEEGLHGLVASARARDSA